MAREEAIAPSAAMAAAAKNNKQRIRRNRDGVNVRFWCVIIDLLLYPLSASEPRKFFQILEERFPARDAAGGVGAAGEWKRRKQTTNFTANGTNGANDAEMESGNRQTNHQSESLESF